MLGTLEESQKTNWKSHVSTNAYKAAVHDSTGLKSLLLLYWRHPRLTIDAFFGTPQDTDTVRSYNDYVDRLKRLDATYVMASKKSARNVNIL